MAEKIKRNMDGMYFMVERDGRFSPVAFSDMTEEEQDNALASKSLEWQKSVVDALISRICEVERNILPPLLNEPEIRLLDSMSAEFWRNNAPALRDPAHDQRKLAKKLAGYLYGLGEVFQIVGKDD